MGSLFLLYLQVGFSAKRAQVRDLYQHKDLGIHKKSFEAKVNPSGVVMVKLSPLPTEERKS